MPTCFGSDYRPSTEQGLSSKTPGTKIAATQDKEAEAREAGRAGDSRCSGSFLETPGLCEQGWCCREEDLALWRWLWY